MRMNINSVDIAGLKQRIDGLWITQERLAISMGTSPSYLSRILSELRPMTDEFYGKLMESIEWEEAVQAAAEETREQRRRAREGG